MKTDKCSHFLLLALLALVSLSMAACGNASSSSSNPVTSGSSTQTSTPATPDSSTQKPTAVTMHTPTPQAQIALALDKSRYTDHDAIEVTITNHLSTPIFISPYYTNCTAVRLELSAQNSWIPQGVCPSAASHSMVLQPGASIAQRLTPASRMPQTAAHMAWQTGMYRVNLFYTLIPDGDITQGKSVISVTFMVE